MDALPYTEHVSGSAASRFAYDVFVVHADAAADEAFVNGYLLPTLGLAPERVLRRQSLELGQFIAEEIERGVRSSRVTIVVLSAAYMDDAWAAFGEQLAAYASVAKDVHGVLLPLLREDCKLTMHVQALAKLDFRDPSRALWDAEIARLRAYLDRPAAAGADLPCPYPGMRPFTEDDVGRFFGRELELDTIVYRLRQGEREIYVIGPSGSGKSSLIAAGLVPRLTRGVERLPRFFARTFRPGEQPLERLAAALEGDVAALAAAVETLLARHPPATSLLLVIDQLEELFAAAGDDQRRDFLAALRGLQADPRCVLVFTLRADFYGAFMTSSLWTDNDGRISRIDLAPPGSESLRVVIERPARDLGVYVQPELVSRLLDDAAREPGALPLLQETLFQLWGKRRERLLALADYQALSNGARTGLAFAVEKHAEFVLVRLTSAQKTTAFRILLRLVNFGEGRADTRRQQPRDALRSEGDAAAGFDAVLQCLVSHRLVTVTGDDQRRDVRVDLAHEILIQAWSTFADKIRTSRAHEQRRRDLENAAAAWRVSGSDDDGLLGPVRLAEAVAWREASAQDLGHTAGLAAFLAASEAAQSAAMRLRRRSTRVAFSGVTLFAAITSTLALVALRNANKAAEERSAAEVQRRHAVEERNYGALLLAESSRFYQEAGRQRLIEAERPLEALPYLVAARQATEATVSTPNAALRMLFAAATQNLPITPPLQHQAAVMRAAFSLDGTRVVTASEDHTARVWDAATGKPLSPPLQHQDAVWSATFSSDGTRVVTASEDKTARVWDAASGKPRSPPLQHQGRVWSAAFSSDGTRIVTASFDNTARVWDAASGKPRSPPLQHQGLVWSAAFSPDGTRVVTASEDNTARVWNAASGKPLSPPLQHQDTVWSAAFSPDGARVVTASIDNTARVWDAASGKPLSPPLQHQGAVRSTTFSPDGTRVVTASFDNTARVWDAATGKPRSPPLQHQGAVWSAVFSPDGTRVVTASVDQTARVWDATTGKPLSPPLQHQEVVVNAAFSSDGTRVVTASWDKTARVWGVTSGKLLSPPLQHRADVASAAFSPDGTRVITASDDKTAQVWDATSGKPLSPPLQHQGAVLSAAFSPDGTRVVTASNDHTACVWDVVTGKPLAPPLQHQGGVGSAAFNPDGTRVVTASGDKTARIWDAATGKPLSPPLQHQDEVWSVAFSPDGTRVVTASVDHTARVWDAATGKPLSPPLQHQDAVWRAAFSPDGTRVVTASVDHTARVWDAASGKPLSPPLQHQATVGRAAFSPDGTRVVTASYDHTARVWDATSGKPLSPPLQHREIVVSAAFSPRFDDTRVVTASVDQTARVWDTASGKPLSPPLQHQDSVWSAAFSPDGARVVTTSLDDTARVWDVPLASGTLAEWRATMDRASPYVLVNGVLSPRSTIDGPAGSSAPGVQAAPISPP
jgi:WD40 repeat protein